MEVREMEKMEPPIVPWIPSTPVKPVPVKPVPIYTAGEGSHMGHVNGAVACTEFSIGQKTHGGSEHLRYFESPIGHVNEAVACTGFSGGQKTHGESEHLGYSESHMDHVNGAVACSEFSLGQKTNGGSDHLGYSELLFRVMTAEPANSNVAQQENNDGSVNPFVSTISCDNFRNSQEISYIAWSSKGTSQDTPFTADNANKSSHMVSVQINVEGKDPGGEEKNAADKLDNNTPPNNKEFCDPLIEFAAVSSQFKENHNLYVGSSHGTDLNKTPQQKPRRRKHRPKVIKEDKPKITRKPATSKPVQSKENPTGKRKYVRRKGLSAASAPPTEVSGELTQEIPSSAETSCKRSLNFDIETKDENSAERENVTALCKGTAIQTDVGLACGMHISMKQASTSHLSLLEETQAPNTSPFTRKNSGTKSKETSTVKRKYVRRKGVNKTPPTEVTGELTKESMPESARMSCTGSVNFEGRARDRSSAVEENVTAHPSNEVGVVMQEMKQVPNGPSSKTNLPGAKAKDNPTVKRKYVRKKGVNKTSPTEVTGELTKEKRERGLNMSPFPWTEMTGLAEAMITESNSMPWGRSLNLETGTRDGSCAGNEKVALEETTASLAYRDTWMKLALNDMPLAEDSTGNLLGAKMNANSAVNKNKRKGQIATQDGNISNSQISMARLQTSGSKGKPSGTVDCADDIPMNMYGAHYNALSAYQANFWVPFPNLQKKRRTEKGKASNTYVTSSMTTTEDQPTYPQAHLHASSSNCWNYGAGYNEARIPATSESTKIDDPRAFEKFILSVRKLEERSQSPTQLIHFGSQTRIRSNTEPNHTSKQLAISEKPKLGDAERPGTCIDALVAETCAPLTKKKRNTKKGSFSRSACSQTNKMQPIGVSSEVIQKTMEDYVNALAEQFRQLNINTEARDLALREQNAIVPYGLQAQNGAIIPYPKKPVKKRRPRPKVNVDDETERVWKLLMLDINSHGVDGTDEAKAKWWEEERNVFRGRADSFIARMHLVQGDRRFSPWKGSVVDSVVGVFLTQNVSDHLSSSAFMLLAARFPKKSNCESKTYCAEDMRLVTTKPQVQIVEPEENTESDLKSLNQSVYDQSSMTVDIVDHSGEKEAVNSNDSCGTTSSVISLTDESNSRLSESSQRNIKDHCSPMRSEQLSAAIDEGEEKSCYIGDGKGLNDTVSSQCSVISSQISGDSSNDQNPEKIGSCSDSNSEVEDLSSTAKYNHFDCGTSFCKLLEMVSSPSVFLKNQDENSMNKPIFQSTEPAEQVATTHSQSMVSQVHPQEQSNQMQPSFFNHSGQNQDILEKEKVLDLNDHNNHVRNDNNEISSAPIELKKKGQENKKKNDFKWDSLRIKAQAMAGKREKTENTMDSMDWEAVRRADVDDIANTIRERGMNNRLADRIQDFLNRIVEDHGSIDLEWLRDVPPDKAKEYLLSIRGLGLKSVECVRLLTLHHLAFPVDTNVGRIAVRLGWVPLQPLPESLQLHLLELYPVLESIQKYLWPRLCKLDQKTLYELHYQMITFGKVFCTKHNPNCNSCPMRGDCRHFASAFASARLALPGPEQKSIVSTAGNSVPDQHPPEITNQLHLPPPESTSQADKIQLTDVSGQLESKSETNICQPIIEEPTTPEQECLQMSEMDMEDAFKEDSSEIPTIKLNMEEFAHNVQNYMQNNMKVQEGEMSKALVALNPQVASIPMPKLKNVSRLRTEHWVYELPDTHPLLEGWVAREPDDPGKYLLAIWTPGETANSIQPPESKCSSLEECGLLCNEKECFSCNSFREASSQIVRGTILIPCRTAMRGRFPLNGTYFQVNEVFADQDSSVDPISVPRSWIWNLNRRTVYFGTSIPTIFKGLTTQEIQQCFWRGYVCVRGFDRKTRAPRPLMARLHVPASKSTKKKEKTEENPLMARLNVPASKPAKKKEKTKEKTKKKSESANSRGSKRKPKQQELIASSSNLQEPKQQELIASSSNLQEPKQQELISSSSNLQETGRA